MRTLETTGLRLKMISSSLLPTFGQMTRVKAQKTILKHHSVSEIPVLSFLSRRYKQCHPCSFLQRLELSVENLSYFSTAGLEYDVVDGDSVFSQTAAVHENSGRSSQEICSWLPLHSQDAKFEEPKKLEEHDFFREFAVEPKRETKQNARDPENYEDDFIDELAPPSQLTPCLFSQSFNKKYGPGADNGEREVLALDMIMDDAGILGDCLEEPNILDLNTDCMIPLFRFSYCCR